MDKTTLRSRLTIHDQEHDDVRGDDSKLWRSFRSGSRESLDIIFEKYAALLYSYGTNLTRDQELIADCIQDVFFELWTKRDALTAHIQSIKYYLFRCVRTRIVRQLTVDMRLYGAPVSDDYSDETEPNIECSLIREETEANLFYQLKTSIKTLSPAQQEAIYLKFYENMTYEQIASVMNTNVKAVYNLIARSVSSLRKFFKAQPVGVD